MVKCEVCGVEEASLKCPVCGRLVCELDFDKSRGVCLVCSRALCSVCGRYLAIGLCSICASPVCEDCAIEVSPVEIVCRRCWERGLHAKV